MVQTVADICNWSLPNAVRHKTPCDEHAECQLPPDFLLLLKLDELLDNDHV